MSIKATFNRHLTEVLLFIILACLGGSLVLIAVNSSATSRIARDTNAIVTKQTQILNAVQKVTQETQLTAETQTKIIICMLKVPIAQRTDDVEQNCRRDAGAPPSFPNQAAKTNNQDIHQNQGNDEQPTNSGSGSGLGNQQPSILPLTGLRVCTPGSILLNGVCLSN